MTHTGCLPATIDDEIGTIGPARRIAAKARRYFILAFDGGLATAFSRGFVWSGFLSQRHPPVQREQAPRKSVHA